MQPSTEGRCPLCGDASPRPFHADRRRVYLRCPTCALVFVPSAFHLAPEIEKAEYDRHENDPANAGYRAFLARLADPLCQRLTPGSSGLDFGCGPGPTLSVMLAERGHAVALYDPFYATDAELLVGERRYDFITLSEVIEHLRQPGMELARLVRLLAPGGWLAIQTQQVIDRARFARWNYIRDPTHVAFHSPQSFAWIAQRHGLELQTAGPDVVLLRRPGPATD